MSTAYYFSPYLHAQVMAADPGDGSMFVQLEVVGNSVGSSSSGTFNNFGSADEVIWTQKTQAVLQSATPVFDKHYTFTVPHYRSRLRLTVFDADSGRAIGSVQRSIYAILQVCCVCNAEHDFANDDDVPQRDADDHSCNWRAAGVELLSVMDPASGQKRLATIRAQIRFEEDVQTLYWNDIPKLAPSGPDEEVQLSLLSALSYESDCILLWLALSRKTADAH